jgi:hypothetical protein
MCYLHNTFKSKGQKVKNKKRITHTNLKLLGTRKATLKPKFENRIENSNNVKKENIIKTYMLQNQKSLYWFII